MIGIKISTHITLYAANDKLNTKLIVLNIDLLVTRTSIFSVNCKSLENLFRTSPVGVTSKYVFTGAWQTRFSMSLNNLNPTDRLNHT